jgi:hypothetical protein
MLKKIISIKNVGPALSGPHPKICRSYAPASPTLWDGRIPPG